jgi:hypothetical protein
MRRGSLWRWMKALEKYQKIGKIPCCPCSEYSIFCMILYHIGWGVRWVGGKWIFGIIRIIAKNGNLRRLKAGIGSVHPRARIRHKNIDFVSFI